MVFERLIISGRILFVFHLHHASFSISHLKCCASRARTDDMSIYWGKRERQYQKE
jgi:hypothetical protein